MTIHHTNFIAIGQVPEVVILAVGVPAQMHSVLWHDISPVGLFFRAVCHQNARMPWGLWSKSVTKRQWRVSGLRELLRRVREGSLDAFANQDVPFDRVVDTLRLERDPSRSPIFQVLFILQNTPSPRLHLPGLQFEPMDVDPGAAKFDLTLSMISEGDGFKGQLEYNTDLFNESTVARMAGYYRTMIERFADSPEERIDERPLLSADEIEALGAAASETDSLPDEVEEWTL